MQRTLPFLTCTSLCVMQGASPLHAAVAGWNPPSPNADFEDHAVGLLDEGGSVMRERMVSCYPSCYISTSPVKQR